METKICPYCKEEIKYEAIKCRYCHEWLNRKTLFKRSIVPTIIFIFFFFGVFGGIQYFSDSILFGDKKFIYHPDSINILSHSPTTDEEGNLFIVGEMKNVGKIPWQSITVQADYYDKKGNLIDSGKDYSTEDLASGEKRSYKIRFGKKQKDVDYDKYKVFIQGADDASRF